MNYVVTLLLALATATARGDTNLGAAYYGIQHKDWPCDESLRAIRHLEKPGISILWHSFGMREECLRRFLDWPKKKILEIQLINECCIRRRDCTSWEWYHRYSPKEWEEKVKRGDAVLYANLADFLIPPAALLNEYRGTGLTCYISPGLESILSPEAQARLIAFIKPRFPQCRFVSYGHRVAGAKFQEFHTKGAQPPCILSNDDGKWPGDDLSSWRRAGRPCRAFFAWHPQFNGWTRTPLQIHERRDRTNWPDKPVFDWLKRNLK